MRKLIIIVIIAISIKSFGQKPFREIIETDSSHIEIVRNSVYKVYEETYKKKDLIWYSVHYIDDTTQLKIEGWETKTRKRLGVWKEFTRNGELMYTRNYDNATCVVNPKLYPNHDILEKMKFKADSLIIKTYSNEFFKNFVKFEFDCYTYKNYNYVGSWIEPLKDIPDEFLFRYSVKIPSGEWKNEMIGIVLNEKGEYIPSGDDFWNNYGFEDVKGEEKTFRLDTLAAKKVAIKNGLNICDTCIVTEFFTWENFKKQTFFNGQFRYYILEQTGKTEYKKGVDRQGIFFHFNVYSFNPWTGEFIEKKKMKSRKEWGKNSGHTTGLIPDN